MRDVIRSLSFSPHLSTWTDLPNPLTCFFHPVTSLHLSELPCATFLSGRTDVLRLPIDRAGIPSALLNKLTDIHHALIDTVNQLYNWMYSAWFRAAVFCLHSNLISASLSNALSWRRWGERQANCFRYQIPPPLLPFCCNQHKTERAMFLLFQRLM